jgi:hypothetical protein
MTAEARTLECRSPKKVLGTLGLVKRVGLPVEASAASFTAGIEDLVHHVCLMRPAELVVTYHQGPKPPSELLSYAGVFRADTGMDDVYARAEPPTHDSWNPQSLQTPESTFVRTTFRRIAEALEGLLELGGSVRGGSTAISLGAASGRFASLVTGAGGLGGASDFTPRSGGSSGGEQGKSGRSGSSGKHAARRARIEYLGDPYLDTRDGRAVIALDFKLPDEGQYEVHVDTAVLAGPGARETETPVGADVPEFLGWESTDGRTLESRVARVAGGDGATWRVLVVPASDTVTELDLTAQHVASAR